MEVRKVNRPITHAAVLEAIRGHVEGVTTAGLEELFLRRPEERLRARLGRSLQKLTTSGLARRDGERWFVTRPRPQPPADAAAPPLARYQQLLEEADGDAAAPAVKAFYQEHRGDRKFTRAANALRRATRRGGLSPRG
jgi:hypothetical protein